MSTFQIQQHKHLLIANDFNELMNMAQSGQLRPSDLIQPEGSNEWLYAGELPKVKDHLSFEVYEEPVKTNTALGIILILAGIVLFYGAYQFQTQIP